MPGHVPRGAGVAALNMLAADGAYNNSDADSYQVPAPLARGRRGASFAGLGARGNSPAREFGCGQAGAGLSVAIAIPQVRPVGDPAHGQMRAT